ncbi:MAG: radical SAM protein [Agathobacter sp.]|nr:radical SAM protein [Agathobacter sp.]
MELEDVLVRYSVITDKNPREIVLLRGSGCRYKKCRFCDYHLDFSRNEKENFELNKGILSKVTGIYQSLEVINSGSFPELDIETMKEIENVCVRKGITQLRFEVHWMYHKHVKKWKEHFKEKGITLKIKMGVETFDEAFRKDVFDKGMEHVSPEEIASVADEVCLLFGVTGQTLESMTEDIETGLNLFERICINIMVENSTEIHPDNNVIEMFMKNLYPKYIDNPRVDILLHNTDFGVG